MTDAYRQNHVRTQPALPQAVIARRGRTKRSAAREQFLDAATHLFGSRGVAATTIAHIAREVGVTSAMVHYHFASRDQLLDAVVAERIRPFLDALWAPVTPAALKDPVRVLQGIAACVLDHVLTLPWLASVWLSDIASSAGELRQRVMHHLPTEAIQHLTAAIQAAQQRGEIDARLQPHMIFMTLVGIVLVPFVTLDACSEVHPDADLSSEALRRHVVSAVDNLLVPRP